MTLAYAVRQCNEFAKVSDIWMYIYTFTKMMLSMIFFYLLQLGMMGTSVFYSSGDDGVAGIDGLCLNSNSQSCI